MLDHGMPDGELTRRSSEHMLTMCVTPRVDEAMLRVVDTSALAFRVSAPLGQRTIQRASASPHDHSINSSASSKNHQ